jgi:divalent metal cation (Fe/Co/Zn/Cd) transporter
VAAFMLGRNARHLLLGEAAEPEQREAIRAIIARHDEIDAVLQLLTMHIGPSSILVAVRVDFRDGMPSDEVERISSTIDEELRERVPGVSEVFLDATPRHRRS